MQLSALLAVLLLTPLLSSPALAYAAGSEYTSMPPDDGIYPLPTTAPDSVRWGDPKAVLEDSKLFAMVVAANYSELVGDRRPAAEQLAFAVLDSLLVQANATALVSTDPDQVSGWVFEVARLNESTLVLRCWLPSVPAASHLNDWLSAHDTVTVTVNGMPRQVSALPSSVPPDDGPNDHGGGGGGGHKHKPSVSATYIKVLGTMVALIALAAFAVFMAMRHRRAASLAADATVKDNGFLPLHIAVIQGDSEAVRSLLMQSSRPWHDDQPEVRLDTYSQLPMMSENTMAAEMSSAAAAGAAAAAAGAATANSAAAGAAASTSMVVGAGTMPGLGGPALAADDQSYSFYRQLPDAQGARPDIDVMVPPPPLPPVVQEAQPIYLDVASSDFNRQPSTRSHQSVKFTKNFPSFSHMMGQSSMHHHEPEAYFQQEDTSLFALPEYTLPQPEAVVSSAQVQSSWHMRWPFSSAPTPATSHVGTISETRIGGPDVTTSKQAVAALSSMLHPSDSLYTVTAAAPPTTMAGLFPKAALSNSDVHSTAWLTADNGSDQFSSTMSLADMINARDAEGSTPLLWAVRIEDEVITQLLLDMGADTNLPNKDSQTALHLAVMCSAESNLVQALLQAQANPNVLDNEKMTPLMYACRRGCLSAVICLLQGGADPCLTDARDMTALMHAAAAGHAQVIAALLQQGTMALNCADANGWTALHWAVAVNDHACVETLLHQPLLEAHLLTKQRESVFHLAARRGSVELLYALCQYYQHAPVTSAILATRPPLRELLSTATLFGETAISFARRLPDYRAAVYLETVLVALATEEPVERKPEVSPSPVTSSSGSSASAALGEAHSPVSVGSSGDSGIEDTGHRKRQLAQMAAGMAMTNLRPQPMTMQSAPQQPFNLSEAAQQEAAPEVSPSKRSPAAVSDLRPPADEHVDAALALKRAKRRAYMQSRRREQREEILFMEDKVSQLDRENMKLSAGVAALRREAEVLQHMLSKTRVY